MENKNVFEQTMEILTNNINRLLWEKGKSMAWLSRKIGTNDRYIARLQRDELVPSLQGIQANYHLARSWRARVDYLKKN